MQVLFGQAEKVVEIGDAEVLHISRHVQQEVHLVNGVESHHAIHLPLVLFRDA